MSKNGTPKNANAPAWRSSEQGQRKEGTVDFNEIQRKPGRPRAVPEVVLPKVLSLYREGLGYRAVARELRKEGISVDWSTIRRIIQAHAGSGPQRE